MHSPRVYFNNIGSICTDSPRHGNGLSALLLLTRAAKSSAAKNSAAKTRSMEFTSNWIVFLICFCVCLLVNENATLVHLIRSASHQSNRKCAKTGGLFLPYWLPNKFIQNDREIKLKTVKWTTHTDASQNSMMSLTVTYPCLLEMSFSHCISITDTSYHSLPWQ